MRRIDVVDDELRVELPLFKETLCAKPDKNSGIYGYLSCGLL